ncbi:MAG: Crp/Fnr family transcriptional regulator [Bacteroidota bacterium]
MRQCWLAAATGANVFRGIPPEALRDLLDCTKPEVREYKAGAAIVHAGEPVAGLGIVLEGAVAVLKMRPSGDQVRLGLFGPGETFGEIAVFSAPGTWPATVTCERDGAVLFLPGDKILGVCESRCEAHRRLALNLLSSISDRALNLYRRLDYLTAGSLRAKVAMYLLEQWTEGRRRSAEASRPGNATGPAPAGDPPHSPDTRAGLVFLPMNRNELAEFLNVPRPSLSRELRFMKADGLIDYHRATVRILDPDGLRKAAEE